MIARAETHFLAVALALLAALPLVASAHQLPNPHGVPVGVEAARRVAQASLDEARRNGWTVAVAEVDPAGMLVHYEKMDNTQLGGKIVGAVGVSGGTSQQDGVCAKAGTDALAARAASNH